MRKVVFAALAAVALAVAAPVAVTLVAVGASDAAQAQARHRCNGSAGCLAARAAQRGDAYGGGRLRRTDNVAQYQGQGRR